MKSLLSVLTLCLLLTACNDGTSTDQNPAENPDVTAQPPALPGTDGVTQTKVVIDETTGEPTLAEKPIYPLSSAIGPDPVQKIDPVEPVIVQPQPRTPQESRVNRVLTNNFWVVQTLIRIKDRPANTQNQGAWFQFKGDGTYDYGFFDKKIASGGWSFDGQTATLSLDSELIGDDREWEVKIGNEEDIMIWVGTERYRTNDTQMRLYNFLFKPKNRSEMGLKEKNGTVE